LSIRFQADNNLKRIIVDATLRREPRIDFQSAHAARLDILMMRSFWASRGRSPEFS
jgi:hypothetical protein